MTNTERLAEELVKLKPHDNGPYLYEAAAVELRRLLAENESTTYMLGNLLARIHRDGGHYIEEHGLEKSCVDADAQVVKWLVMQRENKARCSNCPEPAPDSRAYSSNTTRDWTPSLVTTDCRACKAFAGDHCMLAVQCVNADQHMPMLPVQFWKKT